MGKCSLTGGCWTGDEVYLSGTGFKVDAHQNGGHAIASINIRQADQYSAVEQFGFNTRARSGHDWTSLIESMHRRLLLGLLNALLS
jgi:hypothetical protein